MNGSFARSRILDTDADRWPQKKTFISPAFPFYLWEFQLPIFHDCATTTPERHLHYGSTCAILFFGHTSPSMNINDCGRPNCTENTNRVRVAFLMVIANILTKILQNHTHTRFTSFKIWSSPRPKHLHQIFNFINNVFWLWEELICWHFLILGLCVSGSTQFDPQWRVHFFSNEKTH